MNCTMLLHKSYKIDHYECSLSESYKIDPAECAKEIKKDLILEKRYGVTVWGQVLDDLGQPLAFEKVRLIRIYTKENEERLEQVSWIYTDEKGYYTMDTYGQENDCFYVLVEGKSEPYRPLKSVGTKNHTDAYKTMHPIYYSGHMLGSKLISDYRKF